MMEAANVTLNDILFLITTNPNLTIAVLIQILMGIALGYVMLRVIKYIIAFVGVLVIGALLNVWSLGMSTEDILAKFGSEALKLKDVVMSLLTTLGIITVGPVTLGFLLGILIGLMKK